MTADGGAPPAAVRAYLSLGSNLGDRLTHLAVAVRALGALEGVRVQRWSPVYETTPLGPDAAVLPGQPPYLN
ncbi:MAG: 2-amino-4-hydroxy-6-hydroxymethyldihydropteridine diphosphokinase, partial [Gemmatimonadaceae bacterium]